MVMEGVAGYWEISLYPVSFIDECGTYTFVKLDTRFIHSMDHLHCHTALGRSADQLAWSAKAVESCRDVERCLAYLTSNSCATGKSSLSNMISY
jgi:hypothetical protein